MAHLWYYLLEIWFINLVFLAVVHPICNVVFHK